MQRYLCVSCGDGFQSVRRGPSEPKNLWHAYTFKRQTVGNLSEAVGLSERQVRRKIREASLPALPPRGDMAEPVVLVMDTTYFGDYGVIVFRCAKRRRNLLWRFVGIETVAAYLDGTATLMTKGWNIAATVCDGKKWLCEALRAQGYPVQLCQFHMMKTVTRYLTRHPELQAGIELRSLMLSLPRSTEAAFTAALAAWSERWRGFLKEKTVDPLTGRWQYTHRRIRGACASLMAALPFLFTFERHPGLGIPKTTNTLDGTFSHLKQKIRVHRGLNKRTERKMIETILAVPAKAKTATRNVH